MKRLGAIWAVVFMLFSVSCAIGHSHKDRVRFVKKRATYDMLCAQSVLTVTNVGNRTFIASGCGKQATYLLPDDCYNTQNKCTPILNSSISGR